MFQQEVEELFFFQTGVPSLLRHGGRFPLQKAGLFASDPNEPYNFLYEISQNIESCAAYSRAVGGEVPAQKFEIERDNGHPDRRVISNLGSRISNLGSRISDP